MQYINHYKSPIGGITLGSDGENIIGLWFDGEKYFGDTLYEQTEEKELPVFDLTKQWLDIYFSGNEPDFIPPIKEYGSEFRLTVWEELKKIPYHIVFRKFCRDYPALMIMFLDPKTVGH